MSLRVSIVAMVVDSEDCTLVEVTRVDTAINPSPDDQQGGVLLAAATAERLAIDVGRDCSDRLHEISSALENIEHG